MNEMRHALPSYDLVLFAEAPIELCLVQVKFPPLPRFDKKEYLSTIKEILAEEYPLQSTEQALNIVVTPQGVNPTPGGELLRFSSVDYNWSVVLTNELVSLEARHYSDIGELSTRFNAVLSHVAAHLRPRYQLRFGLRYINELRHPKGDTYEGWHSLLNPELLGFPAHELFHGTVEQTIGELRVRSPDRILLLRHGFLTGTTVVPMGRKPPKTGPFYLLDVDCYDETTAEFNPTMEKRMADYNRFLYDIFRWSIGEGELYQALRGRQ